MALSWQLLCFSGDGFGSGGFDDSVPKFKFRKSFSSNAAMDSCCFCPIISNLSYPKPFPVQIPVISTEFD